VNPIVFLMPPAHGHLNPVLPILQELVRRGERVTCYDTVEFRPQIERTGAVFRAYPDSSLASTGIAAALDRGSLASVTALILESTEQMLPAMLDDVGSLTPGLVVFDSIALWGKMTAAALGVRAAASISHLVMDDRHLAWKDLLRALWQAAPEVPAILRSRRRLIRRFGAAYPPGRPLFPMRDGLNLVFTARELQRDTPLVDATFRFVGPSIDPTTRAEVFDLEGLGSQPVVYVALGTVHPMAPAFFRACVAALADADVQCVVSVGRQADLEALGPVPPNFVLRRSVPQLDVLARARAFVTHAGINGVNEGLYHGVPLVLVPQHLEQLLNARAVAARGAGIVLDARVRGGAIAPGALRTAVDTVLTDQGYRAAAAALSSSMRAAGGYVEAVNQILAYRSRPIAAS
jgi:MGT family glycosyltransferase